MPVQDPAAVEENTRFVRRIEELEKRFEARNQDPARCAAASCLHGKAVWLAVSGVGPEWTSRKGACRTDTTLLLLLLLAPFHSTAYRYLNMLLICMGVPSICC